MTSSLGIDHALVCARDIERTRRTYAALGFLNRGLIQHPWGTSTAILIFRDQLFEIVGIGDPALLDGYEAGGFRFGRHVAAHLAEREGVCLTALHSTDAAADAGALTARGVELAGMIDFGREVTGPDCRSDRTRTRLAILANRRHPRLSLFACQQFRRDLIEMPAWMDHPNGVTGIAGLTVVASPHDGAEAADWLGRVHGGTGKVSDGMTRIATPKGTWTVTGPEGFARLYGAVPPLLAKATLPGVAGIDLRTPCPEDIEARARAMGLHCRWIGGRLVLPEAQRLGGVCLRFGLFGETEA